MPERLSQKPLFNVDVAFGDLPEPDPETVYALQSESEARAEPGYAHVHEDLYEGQRVTWRGTYGRMLKLTWDRVRPVQGNHFYPEKIAAFVELVRCCHPVFAVPPAWLTDVTLQDVAETQEQARSRHRDMVYDMRTRPYTTDDDELDDWLASEDGRNFALRVARKRPLGRLGPMQKRAMEAKKMYRGDLGKIVGQLRDGNHRAFAAQAAGEPFVWVYVTEGQEGALEPRELE